MQVKAVIEILERLAPTAYAEDWDNVGLLVGGDAAKVSGVLFTIDCTQAVLDEALAKRCNLVVAYHPVVFKGIKRVSDSCVVGRALRENIAIYCPHTAWDVAPGGTNDVLAQALGLAGVSPLRPARASGAFKVVFFVPHRHADGVCEAVAEAGAGRIGNYSRCSFRAEGTGTFFAEAGAKPALGQTQRLERVEETRVEVVVTQAKLPDVLAALRRTHPYEEPAFDVLRTEGVAPAHFGLGRVGDIMPTPVSRFATHVKEALGLSHVMLAAVEHDPIVTRVAVCAGAGGELIDCARNAGADVFVTGEVRHHDALQATGLKMSVVTTFHTNTERQTLAPWAAKLRQAGVTTAPIHVSESDTDPFVFV